MPVSVATLAFTVTLLHFARASSFRLGSRESVVAAISMVSPTQTECYNYTPATATFKDIYEPAFTSDLRCSWYPSFQEQEVLRGYLSLRTIKVDSNPICSFFTSAEDCYITRSLTQTALNNYHVFRPAGLLNAAGISISTLACVFIVALLFSLLLVLIN